MYGEVFSIKIKYQNIHYFVYNLRKFLITVYVLCCAFFSFWIAFYHL